MIRSDDEAYYDDDARPLPGVVRGRRLATGTTVEVTFSGGAPTMSNNPVLAERFRRQHGRLRDRRPGRRPERRQHGHGQRQLGLPDDPPRPLDRARGHARPLDPVPRRRRRPAGRRDDAPGRDARRPDRVRALRGPGAGGRRAGAPSARPTVATPPGRVLPSRGAPRWTIGFEPAAPPARRIDHPPRPPPRPSPEDPVAERPHDPTPRADFASPQRLGPRVRDVRRLRPADLRRPGRRS